MSFDPNTLEPQIRQILSAPGIDLNTISAKRVRKQLRDLVPGLTVELLRVHREAVDAVIARVFDEVSAQAGVRRGPGADAGAEEERAVVGDWATVEDLDGDDAAVLDPGEAEGDEEGGGAFTRKRTSEEMDGDGGGADADDDDDDDDDDGNAVPLPKKARKAREMSDAELARQLSSEINGRTRRNAGSKTRAAAGGSAKRGRKLKSAVMVDSDEEDGEGGEDSDTGSGKKRVKGKTKSGGGRAKGGFAKEYALSEPLAAVLNIDRLSRPQVVKHLWIYIKGNELQNPRNKREIICNGAFKAIFKVDKIDMFQMNRVLGQHLHESEG